MAVHMANVKSRLLSYIKENEPCAFVYSDKKFVKSLGFKGVHSVILATAVKELIREQKLFKREGKNRRGLFWVYATSKDKLFQNTEGEKSWLEDQQKTEKIILEYIKKNEPCRIYLATKKQFNFFPDGTIKRLLKKGLIVKEPILLKSKVKSSLYSININKKECGEMQKINSEKENLRLQGQFQTKNHEDLYDGCCCSALLNVEYDIDFEADNGSAAEISFLPSYSDDSYHQPISLEILRYDKKSGEFHDHHNDCFDLGLKMQIIGAWERNSWEEHFVKWEK